MPGPTVSPYGAYPQPYGAYPQPYGGYPQPQRLPLRLTGPGLPRPVAVQAVPGTNAYAVAIVGVAPVTSGPAWASLVAGIGSILVSGVVFCFGGVGASDGWGPTVAGAFALLAAMAGIAAIVLGRVSVVQIRRALNWGATKGRGVAIAGLICGVFGVLLTVVAVATAISLAAAPAA